MEKIFNNKKIVNIAIIVLALLAAVSLVQGCRNAIRDSQDFQWDATKIFSLKINPYDESLSPTGILDEYGYDEYYLQMEANQFPSLLMILLPFTLLKPLAARYTWLVFNLFLTALMIFLLRKTFLKDINKNEFVILSLLMLAGTPYRNQIGVGQHTIFAFTFFLLAVYISEYAKTFNRDECGKSLSIVRFIIVSLCLFICYFKYTLTVPLVLYFIYKKRYGEIALSVIMHVILTYVSAIWLDNSFIDMIVKPLKVSSNLAAEGGLDISALLNGSIVAYVILLIVMISLFILAVVLKDGMECSFISVLALWSLIITYHRTYDFFIMIIVAGGIYELGKLDIFKIEKNAKALDSLNNYFYLSLILVFFVLRVFSENMFSKIVVGVFYYILTFIFTGIVFYLARMNKKISA